MNSFTKSTYLKNLTVCAVLTLGALLFNSCSNDPDPVPEPSYLNITNTSPTLNTYNVYVGANRINQTGALAFGGNVPYGQYTPGTNSIKFTTASSTESVITKDVILEVYAAHSLFLIDKAPQLDYLLVKDLLGAVNSAKTFVRFINLSPNAGTLNLVIKDGSAVVSDKAYKAGSEFTELEAKTYVFQIKDKTTGNVLKEMTSLDAKAGKSYTILAAGLLNNSNTEQAFTGLLITNQ